MSKKEPEVGVRPALGTPLDYFSLSGGVISGQPSSLHWIGITPRVALPSMRSSTSKWQLNLLFPTALNRLTQQLAAALTHVMVTSMCPGWYRTEMGGAGVPPVRMTEADTLAWLALMRLANCAGLPVVTAWICSEKRAQNG